MQHQLCLAGEIMDHLLESRLQGAETAHKLEGLSPDRFGRSAYASLSYTPSKLAGNVLFKEASSMRRVEESSSKAREWEAVGQQLRVKLRHLQEEKEGVEQALSQQIAMYKRILAEAETAHEKSLMALQAAFSEEMQRVIALKEEEAKFVQSEKQLLENRIFELEDAIAGLKAELERQIAAKEDADQTISVLNKEKQALNQQKSKLEAQIKADAASREKQRQGYANSMQQREFELVRREEQLAAQHSKLLQEANLEKQRAIDSVTAAHRQQLLNLEQQRINEAKAKEEEMKKLKMSWESEVRRLEEAVQTQKLQCQLMSEALQQEKERSAESLRKLTSDIATLTHRNQLLQQEVQTTTRLLTESKEQVKRTESASTQTSVNLQATIDKLKREVETARKQIQAQNLERERQRAEAQEMKMEIAVLRKSVERTSMLLQENSLMSRELKGLKDLLVESSLEMERCKGEFLRLDKEKEVLLAKLREMDLENDTLYRIRLEMEEEARIWRETYYLNRR